MWKTAYPNTNLLFWKQTPFLLDWTLAFWLVYSLLFHPKSNLEPRNVQTKCCSLWLQSHVMQDFVWKLKSISHLDFQDECWIDLGNFTALKNKGCLTIAKAQHDKAVLYNSLMPLYSSHAEFLHSSAKEPQAWYVIALCLTVLFQSLFQPPKPSLTMWAGQAPTFIWWPDLIFYVLFQKHKCILHVLLNKMLLYLYGICKDFQFWQKFWFSLCLLPFSQVIQADFHFC